MKLPLGETKAEAGGSNDGAGAPAPGPAGGQAPEGQDFSEFLWMEHEEEYDEQVMKELEDEEMLQYYFEMYQNEVEAETNGHAPGPAPSFPPPQSCDLSRGGPTGDELSREFNRAMTFSTLNPDAAEFVPGQSQGRNNGSQGRSSSISNSENPNPSS